MIRGDHFYFELCSNSKEHLKNILNIAFAPDISEKHKICKYYEIRDYKNDDISAPKALYLYDECKNRIELPYKLNKDNAVDFVWNWLQDIEDNDREDYPDVDGSVEANAFKIIGGGYSSLICVIIPTWSIYSK